MNFSPITDDLLIGTSPGRRDFDRPRELGVGLVINMRFSPGPRPPAGDPALRYVWFRTFDNPLLPIPIRALIQGVYLALEEDQGRREGVYALRGRPVSERCDGRLDPDRPRAGARRRHAAYQGKAPSSRPGCIPYSQKDPAIEQQWNVLQLGPGVSLPIS